MKGMKPPNDVQDLLDFLVAGLRRSLGDNLCGVYLRGSLALGDFVPATSDVDVLAVTEQPVSETEYAQLVALHAAVDTLPNPYANRLEIAYIDGAALRRFRPGLRHPTLGQGETLAWSEHYANWILERWAVREHGVTLFGPAPRTLIDLVSHSELSNAVRDRLGDWADWAIQEDDPDWLLPRRHKAYVVETMCRAVYALSCGALVSKPAAVTWALRTLPEPWRSTVARSQTWREDDTVDLSIVPEVRRFVLWAAACTPDNTKS